jgi:lipopolysaccharide export system ATP-binding protein
LRRASAMALSGGERRRCEIARAHATEPHFILLDEPLAGIDPIAVGDIRDLVAHLKDRGIGVLITDHNVRDTLRIVDRAYILHEGRVLMEGPPAEIVADAEVRRVYLGERFSL